MLTTVLCIVCGLSQILLGLTNFKRSENFLGTAQIAVGIFAFIVGITRLF